MNETAFLRPFIHICRRIYGENYPKSCVWKNLRLFMENKIKLPQFHPNCSNGSFLMVQHSLNWTAPCPTVERVAFRYFLPVFLLLCVVGNMLNLLVYRMSYFQGSNAVHILRSKALANIGFVVALVLETGHAWSSQLPNETLEWLYWITKPYMLTAANLCGTLATWFTLVVTVETLLCIGIPMQFKVCCTDRVTYAVIIVCLLGTCLLHVALPITHVAISSHKLELDRLQTPPCYQNVTRYSMVVRNGSHFGKYQRAYFWTQSMATIVFPTLLMLISSLLIVINFKVKNLGEAFSQRRKCVIRITLATTISHLCLEGPALIVFTAAALKGSSQEQHHEAFCILHVVTNFLAVVNATVPFFLYLTCNDQFRQMSSALIKQVIGQQSGQHQNLNPTSQSTRLKNNTTHTHTRLTPSRNEPEEQSMLLYRNAKNSARLSSNRMSVF